MDSEKPFSYEAHGVTIADPYRSLEELDSPSTREWIAAQNERTGRFLNAVPGRERIHQRLTALSNYERCSIPIREGDRYFFVKNRGLDNQGILYTMDRAGGEPRVLLDPNTLSADGTVALTGIEPSPDARLLAYGLSQSGSDWEEWRVRDVATGRDSPDAIQWVKFSGAAWTLDSKGFFYGRYDEPSAGEKYDGQNFFQKVYYHRLGTPQSEDRIVYHRPDQKEWNFDAQVSDDGRYLLLHVWAATDHNLVFYFDLLSEGPCVELIREFRARYHFVANDGPIFYFYTDDAAPRGRVIAIDTSQAAPLESVKEIIAESDHALEGVAAASRFFVAVYLRDACTEAHVFDRQGKRVRAVALPGIGTASGFDGDPAHSEVFFSFTSFTTPSTVYRYDVESGATSIFHQPPLLFDPAQFQTTQSFATSTDGTRIPIFISHKRGLALDGDNPTELYGYGGFNISVTPAFAASRIAWMEMGGVYAVANIRGGGEYGKNWHEAGTKLRKQNVFDDFIAAAEWLVDAGYTRSRRLAISGRSNGGLLVGACITQRPELFGAAVPGVGVMDMLRFHKFTIGWSWVSDYGSPDDPVEFAALRVYSPYHNIRNGVSYPATLVITGDHDDRVVPGHSYKFAAALQAAQAGPAPILIRIDVRTGHGVGKPVTKQIEEAGDILVFLARTIGKPDGVKSSE